MDPQSSQYAARLQVDYPDRLDRLTTFLRIIWAIPIVVIAGLLSSSFTMIEDASGEATAETTGGLASIVVATALMILFRRRYPRWWFDFLREFTRFQGRVLAYVALLTDRYPSTVDEQTVHLEIDYPDAKHDLNRWLPLVKWLLALPHVIALALVGIAVILAIVTAWFAILLTGRYPPALFDFVVGACRWALRVQAYAFLLVTDRYPPFSLR